MVDLPWDLIHEIFIHLDSLSLLICSLVKELWVKPSLKYLFEAGIAKITDEQLQSFRYKISPGKDSYPPVYGKWDYFRHDYVLVGPLLDPEQVRFVYTLPPDTLPQEIHSFSAPLEALTDVFLMNCDLSQSVLITLLNRLPNLKNLSLDGVVCRKNLRETPPLSRTFLRKLCVAHLSGDHKLVLCKLPGLGLRVPRVTCYSSKITPLPLPEFVTKFIKAFGAGIEYLTLAGSHSCTYNLPSSHLGDSS